MLAGFYIDGQEDARYLGGAGLFTALIASLYSIEVVRFFIRMAGTSRCRKMCLF
ncbi:PTS systemcellobiose-specific IIC component [Vibrio maritimus]|uniref:PTS systemcellobiose-specific IIC component n=1 Tax=Vibrio maritimus TaxID=990268 RepID=A0A090TQ57_9VIBR|nr:PTS systemcellobiose-specific IIC component [Vibrio maritimus]